jgi:hypothetical protein
VGKLKYLERAVRYPNFIHEEIKNILNISPIGKNLVYGWTKSRPTTPSNWIREI